MTQDQHPITPPPELVQQWRNEWIEQSNTNKNWVCDYVATHAARWGADLELKACCEWAAEQDRGFDHELRAARRPKLKSRKQRAVDALAQMEDQYLSAELAAEIRNALEELPDD